MKVLMFPNAKRIKDDTNGIAQVVINYERYALQFEIDYVDEGAESYDLVAVHAGMQQTAKQENLVAHVHGLMWTADRPGAGWEFEANKNVIQSIKNAKEITVPSSWVGLSFERDMHLSPNIIHHGVNWQEWQHSEEEQGYVLYNKNRETTTCNSSDIAYLAENLPNVQFVSTFGENLSNVKITGVIPFLEMKKVIQQSSIYLATAKETGGIGILESMASGKPVLGYRKGAIVDFVQHGINGYLAENKEDLIDGLIYCIENKDILGANSRELAKQHTWEKSVEQVAGVYRLALQEQEPTVSIIIPCYNYSSVVGRAIECAINQNYPLLENIIVVDDGSTDGTKEIVLSYTDNRIKYIYQNNAGVATARNNGIAICDSKYICCLDADDQIEPQFISVCVRELENDRKLGVVYTKLKLTNREGTRKTKKPSRWPGEFDYDQQYQGKNQIPTCCVFRKDAWKRLGGFRQRYAPKGCGSEDAEFWLRIGSVGYDAKLASTEPLFIYTLGGGGTTGDPDYVEIDWLFWHPWTRDNEHPFASMATPPNKSHLVRSYNEPIVSVIIPVGPGHEGNVINALDSMEAQTFRKWECIVVWDSKDKSRLQYYKDAFPFVKWVETEGEKGAGHARNRGVEIASASLIDFLDADDWFYPDMLQRALETYQEMGGDVAVYTDSVGKAQLSQETVDKAELGKILFYDPQTQETVIAQKNLPYDWARAMKQPNPDDMYIWCYISTLHPKEWFEEIGGFDESMISWEDFDLWVRMAFAGKCFIHLEEELMVYPYYTGNRREQGRKNADYLIPYMKGKYERMNKVPCPGCNQPRRRPAPRPQQRISHIMPNEGNTEMFSVDNDMILVDYTCTKRGDHSVIGHAKFSMRLPGLKMKNVNGMWQIDYSYRSAGDRFLVHRDELIYAPSLFRAVSTSIPEITIASQTKRQQPPQPVKVQEILMQELEQEESPLPKPKVLDKEFDLQCIAGVGGELEKQLKEDGIDMPQDIVTLGVDELLQYKGVAAYKAKIIYESAKKIVENLDATKTKT